MCAFYCTNCHGKGSEDMDVALVVLYNFFNSLKKTNK